MTIQSKTDAEAYGNDHAAPASTSDHASTSVPRQRELTPEERKEQEIFARRGLNDIDLETGEPVTPSTAGFNRDQMWTTSGPMNLDELRAKPYVYDDSRAAYDAIIAERLDIGLGVDPGRDVLGYEEWRDTMRRCHGVVPELRRNTTTHIGVPPDADEEKQDPPLVSPSSATPFVFERDTFNDGHRDTFSDAHEDAGVEAAGASDADRLQYSLLPGLNAGSPYYIRTRTKPIVDHAADDGASYAESARQLYSAAARRKRIRAAVFFHFAPWVVFGAMIATVIADAIMFNAVTGAVIFFMTIVTSFIALPDEIEKYRERLEEDEDGSEYSDGYTEGAAGRAPVAGIDYPAAFGVHNPETYKGLDFDEDC